MAVQRCVPFEVAGLLNSIFQHWQSHKIKSNYHNCLVSVCVHEASRTSFIKNYSLVDICHCSSCQPAKFWGWCRWEEALCFLSFRMMVRMVQQIEAFASWEKSPDQHTKKNMLTSLEFASSHAVKGHRYSRSGYHSDNETFLQRFRSSRNGKQSRHNVRSWW